MLTDAGLSLRLDAALRDRLGACADRWDRDRLVERVWDRDASVWTGGDEADWLGWLEAPGAAPVAELTSLSREVAAAGMTDVLVLGMGGSSLCPEVLGLVLGSKNRRRLRVLDSTDPAQIRRVLDQVELSSTLCIVSSKSGSTLESATLADYVLDRVTAAVGADEAGRRCLAITDAGSALETRARQAGVHQVWHGDASIGGRFSALSSFGLVPAAAAGLDVIELLARAAAMAEACGRDRPASSNPGAVLGLLLGVAAQAGRDKATLLLSPGMAPLGWWLEQLIAESTGKDGRGIIPIVDEPVGAPSSYGADRLFVHLRLEAEREPSQDRAVARLADAGHPVAELRLPDRQAIGGEFFRWEMATAVCGAVLGVHPFDQPDVEASKVATRALTAEYEREGRLPASPVLETEAGLSLTASATHADRLRAAAGGPGIGGLLRAHLDLLEPGHYFALLAYVDRSPAHVAAVQRVREIVRDRYRVATTVGFGPRFLHSTGQAFKGGPPTGVFVQLTCDDGADLAIPGRHYSFGVVKAAQALGDFQVLGERDRPALGVHLGADVAAGLARFERLVRTALGSGG